MIGGTLFHLQRAVLKGEALCQSLRNLIHESVARIAFRHHQMDGDGAFGRAHSQDVEVVYVGNPGALAQVGFHCQHVDV